ncbi:MAG: tetratricopeptide repeat protein [Planctomycetota bacterium]
MPRSPIVVVVLWAAMILPFDASWNRAWAGESDDPQTATAPSAEPKDDSPDSLEGLRAAWDASPLDIVAGLRLQDAMVAAGQTRAAESLFRAALRKQPDAPAARFLTGRIQGGDAGIRAMRAALGDRLGLAEGDDRGLVAAWVALAVAEVRAGNGKDAERAASRITALRGSAADWTYLGWIQERLLDRPEDAIRSYEAAIRKDADHLPARNALAVLTADAGRVEEALEMARATVAGHANDATALLHLGLVQALSGDTDAARGSYSKALAGAGRNPDTLASIASAFMDIEENKLAGAALERALTIDPDHVQSLTNAGLLALAEGDAKGARAYFKRASKLRPRDARIVFLRAVSEERLGLTASAVTSYRRAMSLDPHRMEYAYALALALRKKGAYEAAVKKLQEAIRMCPDDAGLHLQLGITLMKQKKYRAASESFLDAAERDPKNARPHFYLAIIYGDHLDMPEEALRALETYARLGGNEPSAIAWLEELREAQGAK